MILLTKEQANILDKVAINKHNILGTTLMENAGQGIAKFIESTLINDDSAQIGIICGKGNNGGDGFAAATFLKDMGLNISIYCLISNKEISSDSLFFYEKCLEKDISIFHHNVIPENLPDFDLVIDAIVGIGFYGALNGKLAPWIKWLNKSNCVISIDIPSGVYADTGKTSINTVKADHTVTMGSPKIGMLLEPGKSHCGLINPIDIGLPKNFKNKNSFDWSLLENDQISSMVHNLDKKTHKYKQGKVLVLAGSIGMTGAAYLSTMGALKSGAGITKTFAPRSLNSIYEKKITEGMTIVCDDLGKGCFIEDNFHTIMNHIDWCDVIIIGPGLGSNPNTIMLLSKLIKEINKPLVIDADGFQPFYNNLELFNKIKSKFVITPHLGEFSKLTGIENHLLEQDLPKNIEYFMNEFSGTLLLKNAPSFVAWESKACVNSTGNPGLATAGSGDVLAGIIASFIAQGKTVEEAAKIGMFIHGKSGDELALEISQRGLIATDLLNKVARVISNYEL